MAVSLNAKDFREDGKKFLNGSTVKIDALRKAIASDAVRNLVQYTPWDTGRARGNWRVNYGGPSLGYDESRRDPTGEQAIAEGLSRVNAKEWRTYTGAFTADLFISNNTPYIGSLEDGRPTRGEFQAHNQGLGFMGVRTHIYLQTKYFGGGGLEF